MGAYQAYLKRCDETWKVGVEGCFEKEYPFLVRKLGMIRIGNSKSGITYMMSILLLSIYYFWIFAMSAIVCYEDFYLMAKCIHFLCISLMVLVFIIQIMWNRDIIDEMHELIGGKFINYGPTMRAKREVLEKEMRWSRFKWIVAMTGTLGMACFFVLVAAPAIDLYVSGSPPVKIDRFGIDHSLPVPVWNPFDTSTSFGTSLALFIQLVYGTYLGFSLCATMYIYLVMAQGVHLQLKMMKAAIENIDMRSEYAYKNKLKSFKKNSSLSKELRKDLFFQCFEDCLIENLNHHYQIFRLLTLMNSLSAPVVFVGITIGTIILALSFLEILSEHKYGDVIASFWMSLAQFIIFYLICWFGQEITEAGRNINTAIYSLKWFELPKRFKVYVTMIQEITKRDMHVSGLLIAVSMETFGTMMNSAYSYFNLLLAAKK